MLYVLQSVSVCIYFSQNALEEILWILGSNMGILGPHPVLFPLGLICHFPVVSLRSYHVIVGQLHSIAGTHLTRWGLLVAAEPICSHAQEAWIARYSHQWLMGGGKCPGSLTVSSIILRCVFFTGSWIFLCYGLKLLLLVEVTCFRTQPLVSAFFPCFRSPPPTSVFSHSPIKGSTCPRIPCLKFCLFFCLFID